MTVILVLLTFIFFLLLDYFMGRNKVVAVAQQHTARPPIALPSLVGGFRLPENLRYHPGHMWALGESPMLVRVGMDEFASKLIGKIDSISLPPRSTWVRQGQKFATITRDGKSISLISPIEGSISDINDAAVIDPETARKDPYNNGWLISVQAPDQKTNFRNLLAGGNAKWWMEAAVNRLHPATAQDGGEAADDFAMGDGWETTVKEFLLN